MQCKQHGFITLIKLARASLRGPNFRGSYRMDQEPSDRIAMEVFLRKLWKRLILLINLTELLNHTNPYLRGVWVG